MNAASEKSVIELPSEFSRREDRELPVIPEKHETPKHMLALAVARNMDHETIKGLMDLQERWERNEARKAYAEALAAFNADPPKVIKDKTNNQYESKYTSIGNLVNTVNASLSLHGLSARWDVDQSAGIKVTCILTHRAGHSESVSMSGPPDDSGKKNPLQQIKSTVTYLKIATFEAVTGIASQEGNADDDGNGAGDLKVLTEEQVVEWEEKIASTTKKADATAVCKEACDAADALNDLNAYKRFKKVYGDHLKFIEDAAKKDAGK